MSRTENVELTVLCLLHKDGAYLLQDRRKEDWKGYTLPGGHVEPGESIVDAVVREMKEESGLSIRNPKLCGIKQFPIKGGRYLVFLFTATEYEGELISSEEGAMHWVSVENLKNVNVVNDFVVWGLGVLEDDVSEFEYVIQDVRCIAVLK